MDVKSGVILQTLGISLGLYLLQSGQRGSGAGFERHGVGVDPVQGSSCPVINNQHGHHHYPLLSLICDDDLAYTPGKSFSAHPIPKETTPADYLVISAMFLVLDMVILKITKLR